MDHAVLVDIDVNAGAKILETLDSAGVDIEVALFATFPEYYDPRLVLAAGWLDTLDQGTGYEKLIHVLNEKFHFWGEPVIKIMKTTDPFIQGIREQLSKSPHVYGRRLGGYSFGGRYLEDGFVFRVK